MLVRMIWTELRSVWQLALLGACALVVLLAMVQFVPRVLTENPPPEAREVCVGGVWYIHQQSGIEIRINEDGAVKSCR